MARHRDALSARTQRIPPTNVRVLRGDAELADAVARAAEGARRLHDRLAARAARDAWMAEHDGQRVRWLRFVRGGTQGALPVTPATARSGIRAASSSPAA